MSFFPKIRPFLLPNPFPSPIFGKDEAFFVKTPLNGKIKSPLFLPEISVSPSPANLLPHSDDEVLFPLL